MHVARHGRGVRADVAALASQVHPVFMLPPLAGSLFGAVLAGRIAPAPAALHLVAVFAGLYTAHVKDGYVDFHVRDEDDDHPLTAAGCRVALAGATLLFAAATAGIWLVVGPVAALLTLPGWIVGYNHAPALDMHPVSATCGYPTGIALALLGGYYVQAGSLAPIALVLAAVFLVVLSGVKAIDDATDYEYDRSIGKRTAAVVLGRARARRFAYALMTVGMAAVAALAVADVLPASAALAPAAFAPVAAVARHAEAELATMLLVRGAYVFLAVLVGAVWFHPLS